jgi:hypothetical protein
VSEGSPDVNEGWEVSHMEGSRQDTWSVVYALYSVFIEAPSQESHSVVQSGAIENSISSVPCS